MTTPATDPQLVNLAQRLDTTAGEICGAIAAAAKRQERIDRPADRHVIRITSANWRQWDLSGAGDDSAHFSLGVRNNGNVPIYIGMSGESPQENTGALKVEAGAVVTVPAAVRNLEVGVDPADVGSLTAEGFLVELYRFWTVQPLAAYGTALAATDGGDIDGGTA